MWCQFRKAPELTFAIRSLVQAASSLGGLDSSIEHRMGTDPGCDPRLVRLSIGLEELEVGVGDMHRIFLADLHGLNHRI